jgi:hypothetical protein
MAIGSFCSRCGRVVFATVDKVGQTIPCPGCGEPLRVVAWLSRDEPANLSCPHCASTLRIVRELHGKRVRCTTCQALLDVSASPWKLTLVQPPDKPLEPAAPVEHSPGRRASTAASVQVPQSSAPSGQAPSAPMTASAAPAPVAPQPSIVPARATLYPWVVPPELIDRTARYRQKGNCWSLPCRCGEVINTLLGAETLVRVLRPAELRVYPDVASVEEPEAGPGGPQRLRDRLPQGLCTAWEAGLGLVRGILLLPTLFLGMLGLPLGLGLVGVLLGAVGVAAVRYPLVALPALAGLMLLWGSLALTLDYLDQRSRPQAMGKILVDPHSPYAIRKTCRMSPLAPRYWGPGDVVEVLRVDYFWGLGRRSLILMVQDQPLPPNPGGFGLAVQLGRLRRAERRVYVLAVREGPEAADRAAAALATVFGLPVGRARLGLGGLRRQ